jgi:predicted GIY-YIG superfamily endonuclease
MLKLVGNMALRNVGVMGIGDGQKRRTTMSDPVVYLIHFDQPYYHAQHYIGTTIDLEHRIRQHQSGVSCGGAHLLHAVNLAGISWQVVRIWKGGHALEKQFKARKNARMFCPVCIQERITSQLDDDPIAESDELFTEEVP